MASDREPTAATAGALLSRVLTVNPPPFALLYRPESPDPGGGGIEVLLGDADTPAGIMDLPLGDPAHGRARPGPRVLAVVPYRQLTERGLAHVDDGTPLTALRITEHATADVAALDDALRAAGVRPTLRLRGARFDLDDASYAALVRRVLREEIGHGVGANFVLRRSFLATIEDFSPAAAVAVFDRLVRGERGAYWTFVVHTGTRVLVGASPERHVSVRDGVATMNPISGTYRYPAAGPSPDGLLRFLADAKESDELYMVLDEELKMMGGVCAEGCRVIGPRLKTMARLAHTEYLIEGRSDADIRQVLRATLFAPTVTGSPLESACRVIARYEPHGRGYYAGVLALLGTDGGGRPTLDSAIMIRTADIDPAGQLRLDVGATLVRHSDPQAEAAETRAKAAGLLAALGVDAGGTEAPRGPAAGAMERDATARAGRVDVPQAGTASASAPWAEGPEVAAALAARNRRLARFWFGPSVADRSGDRLGRALIVDCEDAFTAMLGHQLTAIGFEVRIHRFDQAIDPRAADLLVLGPGPGDPRDRLHPKIAAMRHVVTTALDTGTPLLAVCLGHQVLCTLLGLPVVRRTEPNQGARRVIDLFGREELCGFYNSFAAIADDDLVHAPGRGTVEVSRDPATGEIHALRGPGFRSVQFHPESVLTENGPRILADLTTPLLRPVALPV